MASSEVIFFRLAELDVKINIFFLIFFRSRGGEAKPSFSGMAKAEATQCFLHTCWEDVLSPITQRASQLLGHSFPDIAAVRQYQSAGALSEGSQI